jgi:hypothetical protein
VGGEELIRFDQQNKQLNDQVRNKTGNFKKKEKGVAPSDLRSDQS